VTCNIDSLSDWPDRSRISLLALRFAYSELHPGPGFTMASQRTRGDRRCRKRRARATERSLHASVITNGHGSSNCRDRDPELVNAISATTMFPPVWIEVRRIARARRLVRGVSVGRIRARRDGCDQVDRSASSSSRCPERASRSTRSDGSQRISKGARVSTVELRASCVIRHHVRAKLRIVFRHGSCCRA
jgi:hypothetical protein